MHQFLLNLEKGDLHQVRDPRETERCSPILRPISVMTLEEFSTEKTVPHKANYIRNLQHRSACKLEAFSDCTQGIIRIPKRSSEKLPEIQIGFYLDSERLLLIEDTGFLLPFLKSLERAPLGPCSLTALVLALLESLIEEDSLELEQLEDKMAVMEEGLLNRIPDAFHATVIAYRRELSSLRAFYEQMMNHLP